MRGRPISRAIPTTRVIGRWALAPLLFLYPAVAQGQTPGRGPGQATVQPVQDLRFGRLIPGLVVRVGADDVGARAELEVEGRGRYQVQLILPRAMTSPAGATLPLTFGPADGAVVVGTAGTARPFDPTRGTSVTLTGGITSAQVFLGGTARPAPDQPAGVYTANITVLMARN